MPSSKKSQAAALALLVSASASAARAAGGDWWPVDIENVDQTKTTVRPYVPLAKASKTWRICSLYPHMKDSFWVAIDYGLTEEAKRQGVDVSVHEAGGYDNLPTQLNQFDDCMASQADAIIVGAISPAGLRQKLEEAARRHIVVVAVGNPPGDAPVSGKVFASFQSTGELTGKALLADLKGAKADVVAFPGPQGSGWAEGLAQGFTDALKGSDVKVLAEKFGDTGVNVQLRLIQDALQTYPSMNVVWGTAPTAEAAISAIAESDRPKIKIVSSYENDQMLDAVKHDDILGFASSYPALMGRIAVDMTVRALEKKTDIVFATTIPAFVSQKTLPHLDLKLILAPKGWKPVYSVVIPIASR